MPETKGYIYKGQILVKSREANFDAVKQVGVNR